MKDRLEDALRAELSKEDAELLARFEKEPSAPVQMIGIFRGPFAALNVMMLIAVLAAVALAFYSGWQVAVLDDVQAMIRWGWLLAFGFAVLITVRVWFFMELQTNRILRELKLLELQVARLAAREKA